MIILAFMNFQEALLIWPFSNNDCLEPWNIPIMPCPWGSFETFCLKGNTVSIIALLMHLVHMQKKVNLKAATLDCGCSLNPWQWAAVEGRQVKLLSIVLDIQKSLLLRICKTPPSAFFAYFPNHFRIPLFTTKHHITTCHPLKHIQLSRLLSSPRRYYAAS